MVSMDLFITDLFMPTVYRHCEEGMNVEYCLGFRYHSLIFLYVNLQKSFFLQERQKIVSFLSISNNFGRFFFFSVNENTNQKFNNSLCSQNIHCRQLSAQFLHNSTLRLYFSAIPLFSTAVAEQYRNEVQKNI